jgi:C-terminal processing protease CtpA/Prc
MLPTLSQAQTAQQDMTIDAATRKDVVGGVQRQLAEGYVFPRKANEMIAVLRDRVKQGSYDSIVSAQGLADVLTRDLQAVSHDRHLRVIYRSRGVEDQTPDASPSEVQRREREAFGKRVNYGLERVERLNGNVGYLEIRSFDFDAATVDSVLAAAMSFLSNTDALIIDVRRNGGGEPGMVAAVCSYLLPPRLLINKFYWRPQDRWDEFRTALVSGRHYGTTRPVYVLTSEDTFSGAEEFAYDVQTQHRGEVVGDTTGGGAHPGGVRRVSEHFGVWVPSGRAVNPVTGTNWEGTGVRPDVPVPAEDALRTAHLRALGRILASARDAERREQLQQVINEVRHAKLAS